MVYKCMNTNYILKYFFIKRILQINVCMLCDMKITRNIKYSSLSMLLYFIFIHIAYVLCCYYSDLNFTYLILT